MIKRDETNNVLGEVIAFYLPQFHPVPENNEWWGPGFTEWTNVTRARPLFPGHRQPRLPTELGFYDLRLAEAREAQAQLATDYGVTAFCYWHYWFGGRRVLEAPLEAVLESGQPKMSYCLAWANQAWTGAWYGRPDEVLIEQTYPGERDYVNHFDAVFRFFEDARYLRVDGKPVFVLYKPGSIPDLEAFVTLWRELAESRGLSGIYLIGQVDRHEPGWDTALLDSVVVVRYESRKALLGILTGVLARAGVGPQVVPYQRVYRRWLNPPLSAGAWHPCVMPNWDNTPRKGRRGSVLVGANPAVFERQVAAAVKIVAESQAPRLLFVKSWNEWAEGNYLEPDAEFGRGFLEALKAGLAQRT